MSCVVVVVALTAATVLWDLVSPPGQHLKKKSGSDSSYTVSCWIDADFISKLFRLKTALNTVHLVYICILMKFWGSDGHSLSQSQSRA